MNISRRQALIGASAMLALTSSQAFGQAKTAIALSRQPGILYLPTHVIEKQKLIEKHAEALGVPGVTTTWTQFANGGAQQDALISGNVDIINTGTGPLLLMWDKTKGRVKGICASSAQPLTFISRDPRIKSLKDLQSGDKIAVPTVKVSTQAILLQMAASELFGPDKWDHFDPLTVQMGHPDAFIALKNPDHEVRNHFAAPPFHYYELKEVPGAHAIITSPEIIGSPLSQGQFMTTTEFADGNPKIIAAIRAAAEEAQKFIETNLNDALAIYKEVTGDKTEVAKLADMLSQPGMNEWNLFPQGTMKFATHLHKVGSLKTMPASWQDYYLPASHDLAGN
jgi:NitT/TauT family transport system substrate-binding protein